MMELLREGGWGMYPTMVFGLVAVGAALRFAIRADPRLRGFVESMARAVTFFAVTGFVTGIISTASYVEAHDLRGWDALMTVLEGTKESLHNLALGFTVVSLVHLAVAVGRRRYDARQPLESVASS